MQFFIQVLMAYAAAFGYNQFPAQGGKIMAAHVIVSLSQDISGQYHQQKRERELENRILSKMKSIDSKETKATL